MDKENIDPHSDLEDFKPLKWKKLSKCYPVKRFKTAATSEQEINNIAEGYIQTTQRGAHLGQLKCLDVHKKVKINHCSLDALRSYEQISSDQHMEVSKIMLWSNNEEIRGNSSISGILGGVHGCSIGNLTVNIGRVSPLKEDSL